jgi:hypothetical protein
MLEHATQRFLVPPFMLIFLVGLAVLMDPTPNMPSWFTHLIENPSLVSIAVAIFAAGTAIFAIGFFIATVSVFLVRLLAFVLRKPRGFSTNWSNEAKDILEKMYHFKNFKMEAEQCEQCFLGEVASSHVLSWMRRRWEYYAINLNCAFACVMAIIMTPLFCINARFYWYIIVFILILIFFFNSYQAWREVIDMDNFLVRNFEKIRERNLIMNSSGMKIHAERDNA